MRFSLKKVTLGAVFSACSLLVLLRTHPDWIVPLEFREMDGRDYADSQRSPSDVQATTATPTVRTTTSAIKSSPSVIDNSLKSWLPDVNNTRGNYFTMRDNTTRDDYGEGALVYLHLNKAAGSTTKRCLSSVSGKTRRAMGPVLDSTNRVLQQRKLSSRAGSSYDTLMGGYAFGICDAMKDKKCSYFTILRDPYERLLSSFTYCRRAGMDQTCQALGPWDVSLKEWAVHQGSYFFRQLLMKAWFCSKDGRSNIQFNNLTGIPHSKSTSFIRAPCWFKEKVILRRSLTPRELDSLLNYCVEHLEEWFSVIGLTDQYELTMAMLEEVYKLPFQQTCAGGKINVSDYKNIAEQNADVNKTETVLDWKSELQDDPQVYEALRADIVLYEKALEIFERQKKIFISNKQV